MAKAAPVSGNTLLTPVALLIVIDHQPLMALATRSIAPVLLRNSAALFANFAAGFTD